MGNLQDLPICAKREKHGVDREERLRETERRLLTLDPHFYDQLLACLSGKPGDDKIDPILKDLFDRHTDLHEPWFFLCTPGTARGSEYFQQLAAEVSQALQEGIQHQLGQGTPRGLSLDALPFWFPTKEFLVDAAEGSSAAAMAAATALETVVAHGVTPMWAVAPPAAEGTIPPAEKETSLATVELPSKVRQLFEWLNASNSSRWMLEGGDTGGQPRDFEEYFQDVGDPPALLSATDDDRRAAAVQAAALSADGTRAGADSSTPWPHARAKKAKPTRQAQIDFGPQSLFAHFLCLQTALDACPDSIGRPTLLRTQKMGVATGDLRRYAVRARDFFCGLVMLSSLKARKKLRLLLRANHMEASTTYDGADQDVYAASDDMDEDSSDEPDRQGEGKAAAKRFSGSYAGFGLKVVVNIITRSAVIASRLLLSARVSKIEEDPGPEPDTKTRGASGADASLGTRIWFSGSVSVGLMDIVRAEKELVEPLVSSLACLVKHRDAAVARCYEGHETPRDPAIPPREVEQYVFCDHRLFDETLHSCACDYPTAVYMCHSRALVKSVVDAITLPRKAGFAESIWIAAERGNTVRIRELVRLGASPNAKDPVLGRTPLLCACAAGQEAAALTLFILGARATPKMASELHVSFV